MINLLFLIFAASACGGALAVVFSQNVVRMAFWLVVSLSSVSVLFFMLGADFVGATQLLIYVGGTVVLLIFGVMLTASGPFVSIQSNPGDLVKAAIVGFAFLGLVGGTVLSVDWQANSAKLEAIATHPNAVNAPGYNSGEEGGTVRDIGMALLGVRAERGQDPVIAAGTPHVHKDNEPGHTHPHPAPSEQNKPSGAQIGFLLPFEIISMHLLVVLVGAAYLARAKRRVELRTPAA